MSFNNSITQYVRNKHPQNVNRFSVTEVLLLSETTESFYVPC